MGNHAVAALRRYVGSGTRQQSAREICELCSAPIGAPHRHLLELPARRITCACDACALRFEGVAGGRFRLIPREARLLPDWAVTDAQWEALALPINLAFLFRDSALDRMVAMYPGPAGATESLLPLDRWREWLAANPRLATMEPDVEALLVNRVRPDCDAFLAPLDRCYELTGIIRTTWRGLSGGEEVWLAIREFFQRLRSQAGVAPETWEGSHV